jgi:enoyl-CoA hydratase/carnithine racemase
MTDPAAVDPDIIAALGDAAEHLAVSIEEGVATLELRRPDKHNAISYAMWQAFGRLMPVLAADDDVEVVLLRGTPGGPFSAGADIAEFRTLRADPEGARRYGEAVESGEQAIIDFPKPTVALIEGFAIGGGTQLAVACDLRICGEGSRFGVTPAKLGIVYALPSTERLVETVGAAWARWILLTGDLLDAGTALRIGLVHEAVADHLVVARAHEVARTVASRARSRCAAARRWCTASSPASWRRTTRSMPSMRGRGPARSTPRAWQRSWPSGRRTSPRLGRGRAEAVPTSAAEGPERGQA